MSEYNRIPKVAFILTTTLLFIVLIFSCGDNGTGSDITFEPGEYLGEYRIVQIVGVEYQVKVDTMRFEFTTGGAFRMKLDTIDYKGQDRNFCDVTGSYTKTGDRVTIEVDYVYPQTCVPEEVPAGMYRWYTQGMDIVLKDREDTYDNREIILWVEEDSQ